MDDPEPWWAGIRRLMRREAKRRDQRASGARGAVDLAMDPANSLSGEWPTRVMVSKSGNLDPRLLQIHHSSPSRPSPTAPSICPDVSPSPSRGRRPAGEQTSHTAFNAHQTGLCSPSRSIRWTSVRARAAPGPSFPARTAASHLIIDRPCNRHGSLPTGPTTTSAFCLRL